MKFSLPLTLLASAFLASNVKASFSTGLSWDYLLGADSSVVKKSDKQVVTIDLEQAEELVPYLHSKGQKAICYFSGGTMQKSRKYDYDDYVKAGVQLPETSGWGNHYIDIRNKRKLQPLIKARMKRAKSYGCDGVEVDSLGLYVHNIRDYTKEDTIVFGKWLAETAHSVGIPIGLKNVAGCAEALEPYFDFAVVESCAESPNLCKIYDVFTRHGKGVFIVHYKNRLGELGSDPQSTLSKELGGHKFTCAFSDHQDLHHNSSNFDCSKGNYGSDVGSKPTTTKKTTTTTTTVTKTTTTVIVTPTNAAKQLNAQGATGAAGTAGTAGVIGAPGTAGATGKTTKQPAANGASKGNDKEVKEVNSVEEGGSGVGAAVAIVAAGGVATAAVAGFVFLKKNKKFTSKDEEFNFGY